MIKNIRTIVLITIIIISLTACSTSTSHESNNNVTQTPTPTITTSVPQVSPTTSTSTSTSASPTVKLTATATPIKPISKGEVVSCVGETLTFGNKNYAIIEVDGGNMSGKRLPNVAVDIGYGNRVYWGLTNEYGQLVYAIADKIVLQNDKTEPVTSNGRYYPDEANVPGTERPDLDKGHIIADSLGGVSNAYNITPQDSTLNRHGDQAYMEKVIRDAGGCENFIATITYPNTKTQIPSHYHFIYKLTGNDITDDFDNVNPDKANAAPTSAPRKTSGSAPSNEASELAKVDTNGNGKVTIAEAKAAGYKMPIHSSDWLYKYMDDKDGDGMVGE